MPNRSPRSRKLPAEPANPWRVLGQKTVYENPWIAVTERQVLTPAGRPGIYGTVHYRKLAVGVLPIDDEGCVHLVGQYRMGCGVYSWEMPQGGGVREIDPRVSAERELLEETGLVAHCWLPALTLEMSNSVTDEVAYCFLAWQLEQRDAEPDETEAFQHARVGFEDALSLVDRGDIRDAMTVATLFKVKIMAATGTLPEDLARRLAR